MNSFNSIFLVIKKHSGEKGVMDGSDIFDRIAREADIPLSRVHFLLNTLQDLQLIKYSPDDYYIKLTSFGKKQERLFTDTER